MFIPPVAGIREPLLKVCQQFPRFFFITCPTRKLLEKPIKYYHKYADMEQPLFIGGLQKQFVLYQQKEHKPTNIAELCWQIRPYVVLHQIRITDSAFIFAAGAPIHYADVISFAKKNGALKILLKNGRLCLLSGSNPSRWCIRVCDPEEYARTGRMQPWWRTCASYIKLFWWNTKEFVNRKIL